MLFPLTLIVSLGSGRGAGPPTTAPVAMLYWLPWQGQSMVPLLTWLTVQPMWVQMALNALKSPADGWVTTTLGPLKIVPPPTGMSLVAASAFAAVLLAGAAVLAGAVLAGAVLPDPAVLAAVAALLAGVAAAAAPAELVAGLAAAELLELPAPQAVIAPARPTRPAPASTPRRVASESVCGSCVTTAPTR
jgi:hypothetical protein